MANTNGDKASSKFIDRVTSYPVVSDGIENFKQNAYGKKSLEIADGAYQRFAKPVEPYLETPYSYAKPYVTKADELAASGLGHVDQRFPIVKEDTNTIVDTTKSYVFWPFKVANDGKNYVFSTWNDEYEKTANHGERGRGVTTSVMAIFSTELKIASDFFQAVADFLGPKYEESKQKGAEYLQHAQDHAEHYKQKGGEYVQQAQDSAEHYKNVGQDKVHEYAQMGQQKADEYAKMGQQKKDEAKSQAHGMKEDAKSQAYGAKEEAKGQAYGAKEEAKKQTQQK